MWNKCKPGTYTLAVEAQFEVKPIGENAVARKVKLTAGLIKFELSKPKQIKTKEEADSNSNAEEKTSDSNDQTNSLKPGDGMKTATVELQVLAAYSRKPVEGVQIDVGLVSGGDKKSRRATTDETGFATFNLQLGRNRLNLRPADADKEKYRLTHYGESRAINIDDSMPTEPITLLIGVNDDHPSARVRVIDADFLRCKMAEIISAQS